MRDRIEDVLRTSFAKHSPRVIRLAYCSFCCPIVEVGSLVDESKSHSSSRIIPDKRWNDIVRFLTGEHNVFSLDSRFGGFVTARVDHTSFIVIQYTNPARMGVFSVVAENIAKVVRKIKSNDGDLTDEDSCRVG